MKLRFTKFLFFIFCLLNTYKLVAQCNPIIANDSDQFVFPLGGYVKATTAYNNTLYIGGVFSLIGQNTGHFIGIDTANGHPINRSIWPKINGAVYKAIPDGIGGWIIGGSFSKAGDSVRHNLVQIDSSGHVTAFNPNPDSLVKSLLLIGADLYVSGNFRHICGGTKTRLAKMTFPSCILSMWAPNPNNTVNEIQFYGSKLYVGGWFTNIGGMARNYIASIDTASGNAYVWNAYATGSMVQTITFHNNLIYVGGSFNNIGGQPRSNIASIDTGTAIATTWDPHATGTVNKIIFIDTTVYALGSFNNIGSQLRNGFGEVDEFYGLATPFNPTSTISYYAFYDMVLSGSKLFIGGGGYTSRYGYMGLFTHDNYIGVIDIPTATFFPEKYICEDQVYTLGMSGNKLFAGGDFSEMGCKYRLNGAAIDMDADTITNWNPEAFEGINCIAVSPTRVYIGGDFTTLSTTYFTDAYYFAATDPLTGKYDSAFTPNVEYPSVVNKLLYDNGNVYVAGYLAGIGGYSRSGVAKVSATDGSLDIGWNPSSTFTIGIKAMAADSNQIYLGGNFYMLGGQPRNNLGAVSKVTGLATAWNPNVSGTVYDLLINNGKIFAGGYFNTVGADTLSNLAKISTVTGIADAWNPAPNEEVELIRPYYNTEIIFGWFDHIDTTTLVQGLGSVNVENNTPSSWNPHPGSDSVYDMAIHGDKLYVGGWFTSISGQNQYPMLIVYRMQTMPDTINISGTTSICAGAVAHFNASTIAGSNYQWRVNGSNVGFNTDTFSYTPAVGDQITCTNRITTTGCYTSDSATSNRLTMVVNPVLTPTVTVTGASNVCFGDNATYIASTSVPSPSFIWKINGINAGTGSTHTYTPLNGDTINCKITIYTGCYNSDSAVSNKIGINVSEPIVPIISINGPATSAFGNLVTINATVANAGSLYQIYWYKNGYLVGTTSTPIFTYTKSGGTDIIKATVYPLSSICYDTTVSNSVYVYQAVGIKETEIDSAIQVYPNPFNDFVLIKGLQSNERICVYDLLGRKIMESTNIENPNSKEKIEMKHFVPGTYLMFIWDEGGNMKTKIVLEKE